MTNKHKPISQVWEAIELPPGNDNLHAKLMEAKYLSGERLKKSHRTDDLFLALKALYDMETTPDFHRDRDLREKILENARVALEGQND